MIYIPCFRKYLDLTDFELYSGQTNRLARKVRKSLDLVLSYIWQLNSHGWSFWAEQLAHVFMQCFLRLGTRREQFLNT